MNDQKIAAAAPGRSPWVAGVRNLMTALNASLARKRVRTRGVLAAALAGLLLSISGCAQHMEVSPAQACQLQAKARLPITLQEGRVIALASLNGQPVRMMVDTGASISSIAPHIAESLGPAYKRDRFFRFEDTSGLAEAQRPIKVKTIQIGALHWFDFEVMVASVARVEKRNDPEAVGGIIGNDLLRLYDVELDVQSREMTLYQALNCKGNFVPWQKPYEVLRSSPNRSGSFIVPVELNGRTVRALVATGTSAIFVDRTAAIAVGVDPAALEQAPKISNVGIDGFEGPMRFYRFDSLDIADRKIRYSPLAVSDSPLLIGIDMLVGTDFWWNYRMWMSYQTGQVFIQEHFRTPDVILPSHQ